MWEADFDDVFAEHVRKRQRVRGRRDVVRGKRHDSLRVFQDDGELPLKLLHLIVGDPDRDILPEEEAEAGESGVPF